MQPDLKFFQFGDFHEPIHTVLSRDRSEIEGTVSQGIRGFNLRKCRYIRLEKTRL